MVEIPGEERDHNDAEACCHEEKGITDPKGPFKSDIDDPQHHTTQKDGDVGTGGHGQSQADAGQKPQQGVMPGGGFAGVSLERDEPGPPVFGEGTFFGAIQEQIDG